MTKLSILNLVPKYKDETKKEAFERAVKLAQFADSRDATKSHAISSR